MDEVYASSPCARHGISGGGHRAHVTGLLRHPFLPEGRGEGASGGLGGPYLHQIAAVDACIKIFVASNGGGWAWLSLRWWSCADQWMVTGGGGCCGERPLLDTHFIPKG
jgi:hypothetical protein